MKLVSINIETFKHHDTVKSFLEREKPDVVCFQEILEEDLGMYQEFLGWKYIWKPMKYVMSPTLGGPLNKLVGVALFAPDFIEYGSHYYTGNESNTHYSLEECMASPELLNNHVLVWADIAQDNNSVVRIATTHFVLTKEGESTPYQLEVVDTLIKKLDELGDFVLVGDLNAPRGNETFGRLAAKYTDAIPPEYKTSLDQKLHRVPGLMLMVDGCFTTNGYTASNVRLVDGVSDHMAIAADITKKI